MKRNIFKFLIASLIISAVMSGCKDERNNYMVDDTLSFVSANPYASVSVLNEIYEIAILKNGKGQSSATAKLTVSEDILDEYNTLNGTSYVLLPADYYKISSTDVGFTEKEIRKSVKITWKNEDLIALGDAVDYAIPIQLTAVNNSLEVAENRDVMIINPMWSYVSMESTIIPSISPKASREMGVYENSIVIDNPISVMDITVNYAIDNTLIDAYNIANGTSYLPAPEGLVSLAAASSVIAAGKESTTFKYHLNSAKLFDGNTLKNADGNNYLVPVRITALSSEAVGITENNVMYVPISMNNEVKGPWTVLEGQDICYANQEGNPAPNWAMTYTADRLFDGNLATEWISWWDGGVNNRFPMTFVADMGEARVFTKFRIGDHSSYQGSLRNYEIYTAEEYKDGDTVWNLVAKGLRDYYWTGVITYHDYPPAGETINMIAGRYLKFVILNHQRVEAQWTGEYAYGRCKLMEVYGYGF